MDSVVLAYRRMVRRIGPTQGVQPAANASALGLAGKLLKGQAGDIRDVRGHQRQHAGRYEGQEAGREGNEQRDIWTVLKHGYRLCTNLRMPIRASLSSQSRAPKI